MLSKNQIKLITSLQQKKYRNLNGLFLAEGFKVIEELLNSHFVLEHLYVTDSKLFKNYSLDKIDLISESELRKITALSAPNNCLAIFRIPSSEPIEKNGLIMALDDIRDPGNLGTIMRLCDWFGIKEIVCSNETVDVYNPKVIQATMGSISRVRMNYLDLADFLKKTDLPVYGTFMEGTSIYEEKLPEKGVIVMGNEANGISESVKEACTHKISIPRFGELQKTESLNVATAAAIILNEFKRPK